MLTVEQINQNKEMYLNLVRSIQIPGCDIEGLIAYIEGSDFFVAPASTIYHSNYEGGLCEHSLHVYSELVKIAENHADIYNRYDPDSLKVIALFHDFAKINFYEKSAINKKVYDPRGSKHDELGNFDWFSEMGYKVKDISLRSVAGTHGYNSLIIVNRFIPLADEEAIAILNHHFITPDENNRDISEIYNRYPLASALHIADMCATYMLERVLPQQ